MELCEKNLDAFIYRDLDTTGFNCPEHFAADQCPPIWCKPREILGVMFELVSGVEYIHKKDQVHRDLKPPNGIYWFSLGS
jgi:serine/threonine protein kinase